MKPKEYAICNICNFICPIARARYALTLSPYMLIDAMVDVSDYEDDDNESYVQ